MNLPRLRKLRWAPKADPIIESTDGKNQGGRKRHLGRTGGIERVVGEPRHPTPPAFLKSPEASERALHPDHLSSSSRIAADCSAVINNAIWTLHNQGTIASASSARAGPPAPTTSSSPYTLLATQKKVTPAREAREPRCPQWRDRHRLLMVWRVQHNRSGDFRHCRPAGSDRRTASRRVASRGADRRAAQAG